MSAFLLDANLLVALMWAPQEAHSRVQDWFSRNARQGWATCPFTQAAFIRIVSNPAFSPNSVTVREAAKILDANLNNPYHRFWADEISFGEAIKTLGGHLRGHPQVTDAYLLGLVIHNKGRLATLDRSIASLLGDRSLHRDLVELI